MPSDKGRNRDAAAIEHAHRVDEAVAFLAQQILRRDHAVFKNHLRGVAGPQAELVLFLAGAKSFGIFLHDEGRKAVRVGSAVGHRDHDDHVGIVAVGAESFRAVENPIATLAPRGHAGAARVRSGRGLSQSPCADQFTGRKFADVLLFCASSAGKKDVIGAERRVCGDNDANRAIDARQLLDRDHIFHVAHARAAVLGGKHGS
jgi:hypothetical protein